MPIYLDFFSATNKSLVYEKQQNILRKSKKEYSHSEKNLSEASDKSGDQLGGEIIDIAISNNGILTFVKDRKEPIRSYADAFSVNCTTALKHILPLALSNASKNPLKGLITLLAAYFNRNALSQWLERFFNMFPALLKDEYWSQPVKEVRRVLKGKIADNFIDFVSMILEYDSAYKNRFQDVVPLLDKSKLHGFSAIFEVRRLFKIVAKRDYDVMADKWNKMGMAASALMIIPKIRNKVILILKDLNLEEIKFNEIDDYWINQMPSYNYKGLTLEERNKLNIKKYGGIK